MFIEAANHGGVEVVTYKILKCCKNNETVDGVEIIRSGGRFTVYLKAPQYFRKHAGITLTEPTKQTNQTPTGLIMYIIIISADGIDRIDGIKNEYNGGTNDWITVPYQSSSSYSIHQEPLEVRFSFTSILRSITTQPCCIEQLL